MILAYMTTGDGENAPILDFKNLQILIDNPSKGHPPQLIGREEFTLIEQAIAPLESQLKPNMLHEFKLDWGFSEDNQGTITGIIWEVITFIPFDESADLPF